MKVGDSTSTITQLTASFTDGDITAGSRGDSWVYYSKMADGTALPAWLTTFSNDGTNFSWGTTTITDAEQGSHFIIVEARDKINN